MPHPTNKPRSHAPRLARGLPAFALVLAVLGGCPLTPGSGNGNNHAPAGNLAPLILNFDVTPTSVNVGEPVTISWRVLDPNADKLSATVSVDREQRADYQIADAVATTSQVHTFGSAGTLPVLLRVSDGFASAEKVVNVDVAGPIAIDVFAPYGGQTITGGAVHVCATIRSEFDVASVVVDLADRSAPLAATGHSGGVLSYCGDVDLADVPSGPQLLTFRVRDVKANQATALRGFVINQAPVGAVLEPLSESVVGNTVRIHLRCTDVDSGACAAHASLKSSLTGTAIDLGDFGDELDQTADVAGMAGKTVFIQSTGAGISSPQWPYFHVEPSARLGVAQEAEGRILDADATRLLVGLDPYSRGVLETADTWRRLVVVNRADGGQPVIPLPDGAKVNAAGARLLEGGVAYRVTTPDSNTPTLYWWSGATPLALAQVNESRLSGAGHFVAWSDGSAVRLFDASSGAVRDVAANAFTDLQLDAQGTLIYIERGTYAVQRYHAGVTTTLYQKDAKFTGPARIDGENTLLIEFDRVGSTNQRLLLIDATGTATEVAPDSADSPIGGGYDMRGGWIAFHRTGPSGVAQIWRRSPVGELSQVTFFGDSSAIEGIDAAGGVMLIRGGSRDGKRYFGAVGKELVEISYPHGATRQIEGSWKLLLGRVLLDVTTQ